MKQSQRDLILNQLTTYKVVSRNYALSNNITRLAAIINQLKKDGYDIEGQEEGSDYVYYLRGEYTPEPKEKKKRSIVW